MRTLVLNARGSLIESFVAFSDQIAVVLAPIYMAEPPLRFRRADS